MTKDIIEAVAVAVAVILSILSFRPDRRKKEAETQDSGASAIRSLTESVATMSSELGEEIAARKTNERVFRDEITAANESLNTLQDRIRLQTAELETERAERARLETAVSILTADLETERTERRRESELRRKIQVQLEDAQVQLKVLTVRMQQAEQENLQLRKENEQLTEIIAAYQGDDGNE